MNSNVFSIQRHLSSSAGMRLPYNGRCQVDRITLPSNSLTEMMLTCKVKLQTLLGTFIIDDDLRPNVEHSNSWNSFQLAKKLGRKLFNCRTLGHVSPWTESFLQKISAAPFVTWCPTRSQRTLTHKWFDPWRRVIAPRFQILLFSWAYRMMIYGFVFQGIGSRPNM